MTETTTLTPEFMPTDEVTFNDLVDRVITAFPVIKNRDHAIAVIANRIMHLPPDEATSSVDYFGRCVVKNLAFQNAKNMGQKASQKSQIDELVSILTVDKNDQQTKDALERAAGAGSEYAKQALDELNGFVRLVPTPIDSLQTGQTVTEPIANGAN